MAGQIGLVPGSMLLVEGGEEIQCRLALRHCHRVIAAMRPEADLRDVTLAVCYVTTHAVIMTMRREWESAQKHAAAVCMLNINFFEYAIKFNRKNSGF